MKRNPKKRKMLPRIPKVYIPPIDDNEKLSYYSVVDFTNRVIPELAKKANKTIFYMHRFSKNKYNRRPFNTQFWVTSNQEQIPVGERDFFSILKNTPGERIVINSHHTAKAIDSGYRIYGAQEGHITAMTSVNGKNFKIYDPNNYDVQELFDNQFLSRFEKFVGNDIVNRGKSIDFNSEDYLSTSKFHLVRRGACELIAQKIIYESLRKNRRFSTIYEQTEEKFKSDPKGFARRLDNFMIQRYLSGPRPTKIEKLYKEEKKAYDMFQADQTDDVKWKRYEQLKDELMHNEKAAGYLSNLEMDSYWKNSQVVFVDSIDTLEAQEMNKVQQASSGVSYNSSRLLKAVNKTFADLRVTAQSRRLHSRNLVASYTQLKKAIRNSRVNGRSRVNNSLREAMRSYLEAYHSSGESRTGS